MSDAPLADPGLQCNALVGKVSHLNTYGAISTFRRMRAALWPAELRSLRSRHASQAPAPPPAQHRFMYPCTAFPVYASAMTFPHPSASKSASGFGLFTRCLPRSSNGLAVMSATLGSFYWLGFETSDLSSDKKRLAWLGAQRLGSATGYRGQSFDVGVGG